MTYQVYCRREQEWKWAWHAYTLAEAKGIARDLIIRGYDEARVERTDNPYRPIFCANSPPGAISGRVMTMQCRYCGRETQIIETYQGFPRMHHIPGPVCGQCISSPKRRRMYQDMVARGLYDIKTRSLISPPGAIAGGGR